MDTIVGVGALRRSRVDDVLRTRISELTFRSVVVRDESLVFRSEWLLLAASYRVVPNTQVLARLERSTKERKSTRSCDW